MINLRIEQDNKGRHTLYFPRVAGCASSRLRRGIRVFSVARLLGCYAGVRCFAVAVFCRGNLGDAVVARTENDPYMSAVRVGIALPTRETILTGAYDSAPLLELALRIEALGFDSVWAGDSFVARPRLEPLTLLAAVAAVTRRVTIGTAALIAVLREPLMLAQTIATLDQVSGGRVRLGIGTGSPLPIRSEMAAVRVPYSERAGRVDEAVTLFRRAWNGGDGALRGKYWDLEGLRRQPPPAQPGGPAFWLASNGSPRVVARIAGCYDGWMPLLPDAGQYARAWSSIRDAVSAAGRDPGVVTPSLFATINVNSDAARARADLDYYSRRYYGLPLMKMSELQPYFGGPERECAEWLAGYVRAGARHIVLRIGSFDEYGKQLHATAETVLPMLRSLTTD
jgi:alkanesulfonate monooxygenase SsuD/methylene tetrahydromethanopterin reductase-like flavin-dependent oxidoreductase (luciferase family)